MSKILVLSTYPIENPQHGGMHRARAIVDHYASLGHEVQAIGVNGSDQYESAAGFVAFPGVMAFHEILSDPSVMEDYCLAKLFGRPGRWFDQLVSLVSRKPDVIHVEQPWLFEFAMRYRERYAPESKLLYGSQNIEYRLRSSILEEFMTRDRANQRSRLIRDLEITAAREADVVIAVSPSDQAWLANESKLPVVMAPNGVAPWSCTETGMLEAQQLASGFAYAIYVASAHLPNVKGFFEMLDGAFGSLKPDERLVLAGGVGWAVMDNDAVHRCAKLPERVLLAGYVGQDCLHGLIDRAHCIVLPITQGGGTNLKTAEALWAAKHIVATPAALRGFERFKDAKGVQIADNSSDFKRALRDAMESPPVQLTDAEKAERSSVLWSECLAALQGVIASLTTERALA